jgi:hypothetical protein
MHAFINSLNAKSKAIFSLHRSKSDGMTVVLLLKFKPFCIFRAKNCYYFIFLNSEQIIFRHNPRTTRRRGERTRVLFRERTEVSRIGTQR